MTNQLELRQLVKRQNQLFTRRQALAAGVHPNVLHRRVRPGGPWQEILPGVYLTVTGTPTRDQRDIAAALYAGPGGTLTGSAALARHGMRVSSRTIDVLIPANRRRQSAGFAVLHRTTRLPPNVCYSGPVQFALPARAVADAVRTMRDLAGVRAPWRVPFKADDARSSSSRRNSRTGRYVGRRCSGRRWRRSPRARARALRGSCLRSSGAANCRCRC